MKNRRFVLAAHVTGLPTESDYAIDTVDQVPACEGQVPVRDHFVSVDPIMPLTRLHGRIVVSDQTADYNLTANECVGLKNTRASITHRLKIQGLAVFDHVADFPKPWAELTSWILDARRRYREDVVEGLEALPAAFVSLFWGENFGRKLARRTN